MTPVAKGAWIGAVFFGVILAGAGLFMVQQGRSAHDQVRDTLSSERIVTPEDAGVPLAPVTGPEEAKAQADMLADKLGVTLVRIVSFNENSGGYPTPYYGYGVGGVMAKDSVAPQSVPTPAGENTISSHVMITYEIR